MAKKSRGIIEFEEGKNYFVGSLKDIAKWTRDRLNPEIKKWVIITEEDYDTLQEENISLWDELEKLGWCE